MIPMNRANLDRNLFRLQSDLAYTRSRLVESVQYLDSEGESNRARRYQTLVRSIDSANDVLHEARMFLARDARENP